MRFGLAGELCPIPLTVCTGRRRQNWPTLSPHIAIARSVVAWACRPIQPISVVILTPRAWRQHRFTVAHSRCAAGNQQLWRSSGGTLLAHRWALPKGMWQLADPGGGQELAAKWNAPPPLLAPPQLRPDCSPFVPLSCLWVSCSSLASSSSSTASCSRSEPALSTDGEAQRWLRRRLPLPPLPPHSSLLTSSSSSTPTAMGLSPPPPEGVQMQEQHQQQQQRQGQGRQHKGQQRLLQT